MIPLLNWNNLMNHEWIIEQTKHMNMNLTKNKTQKQNQHNKKTKHKQNNILET